MDVHKRNFRWVSLAVVLVLFIAGCGGSAVSKSSGSGEEAAADSDVATSTAPTEVAATVTSVPEPTATSAPTPTPEPERDPLLVGAEEVALEFTSLSTELFDDPLNMDISRMIQLEAGPDPVQPMTNWTLRAVNNLVEENRYQPAEDVKWELIGSQWDPEHPGQLAWVDVCTQTGGVWFDIDSDEEVMLSHPEPFVERFRILTDTMQVAAISEDPEETGFMACEFTHAQS